MNRVAFLCCVATFLATVIYAQAAHPPVTALGDDGGSGGHSSEPGRTWVSGNGNDSDSCSRSSPCRTFDAAIRRTAENGEIDVLDPGSFGPVTITKGIKIDGTSVAGGVLASGTNGIVVNAPANATVILRNLSINGGFTGPTTTRGLRFLTGGTLIVDHCEIYGFTQRNVSVELSVNGSFFMNDSNVYSGLSNGIVVLPAGGAPIIRVVLNNVNVHDNTNFGVFAGAGSSMMVSNSRITGNGLAGLAADQSTGRTVVDTESTIIYGNGTGIQAGLGASTVRISNTTISSNTTNGFAFLGGTVISYGNNHIAGNGGSNGPPNGGLVLGNPE
jgi:hypothetical protein